MIQRTIPRRNAGYGRASANRRPIGYILQVVAAIQCVYARNAAAQRAIRRRFALQRVSGRRMLQSRGDEPEALFILFDILRYVVEIVAHLFDHDRLFVELLDVVGFDVEPGELVIGAASAPKLGQGWVRAAEHREDDGVRGRHVSH